MTHSPIIIVKKIEKSNITVNPIRCLLSNGVDQGPHIPQLNPTIRNCLFYCAYSKNLEGKLLQKQARDFLKRIGVKSGLAKL